MDPIREYERRTYSLCRIGFALLSFALVIASITTLVGMPFTILPRPVQRALVNSAVWRWSDTPIVWTSLIGVYLLWGRWSEPSWLRRSGLLLLMSIVDLILWFLTHGEALGLRLGDFGHLWLRSMAGEAIGWAEFALTASLACDVLIHLGVPRADETSRATRSLAGTGAVLWMLYVFQSTDWQVWPIEHIPIRRLETLLLMFGWNMVWMIALIQVSALTIAATRQCTQVIAEMDAQDAHHDLLKLPSEQAFIDRINPFDETHPDDRLK
jgi:hypothetical protein